MAKKFLTPIDLVGNELQNARIQNLATPPSNPGSGAPYFDTALGTLRFWNGGEWVSTDARQAPLNSISPTRITNFNSVVVSFRLDQFAVPTAAINFNNQKLTNVPVPSGPGEAAEYSWVIGQVQSAASGISSKAPVKAVATTNVVTLAGTQIVDTVAVALDDRVLLTAQTAAYQNGVWIVKAGAWVRPTTSDNMAELTPGATWLAIGGSNAGSLYRMATTGTITVGTTPISIVQFSSGQSYTAGNGLTGTSTFSVLTVAGGGITAGPSGVQVDATVVRKFALPIGDGSATSFVIPHGLATRDVTVRIYMAAAPGTEVEAQVDHTDANSVTILFASAPAVNAYRVVVQG